MALPSHSLLSLPPPVVFGHRGAAGERPENTLESFRHGAASGAAALESDLHLTADGEVVLMHDPLVDRTTNGKGPVAGFDLRHLRALDAGYRFTADGGQTFPFRGQGLRVPTLAQFLGAFPDMPVNFEIKDRNRALVEKTVDLIAAAGRDDGILLTAEDNVTMRMLRGYAAKTGSRVALGASKAEAMRFLASVHLGAAPPPGVMALQVPRAFRALGHTVPVVTPAFIGHAHKHGIKVHAWTINDPAEMVELRRLGVDGIFTDFPASAARVFAAPLAPSPARKGPAPKP